MKLPPHPGQPLWVASVLDPAWDTSTEAGRAAVVAYATERTYAAMAAIPVVTGEAPVLWRVRPLTTRERTVVGGNASEGNANLDAVRYALLDRLEGATVTADGPSSGRPTAIMRDRDLVTDAALDAETAIGGGSIVDELGVVIRHRADLHPRRFSPFRLPQRVAALL